MPPTRYVGRVVSFKGKRLYDILCRLKNFGVGRLVYRHVFNERYPEPSYYIITKVQPDMSDPTLEKVKYCTTEHPSIKSVASGIRVFRGENVGECDIRSGFKADWRLIPRDEEHRFTDAEVSDRARNAVPSLERFPPLLEHFILKEQGQLGKDNVTLPTMDLNIQRGKNNRAMYDREEEVLENLDGLTLSR